MSNTPYFLPTFGNRPRQIVGREHELHALCGGLDTPLGSRERCTLILGQRGMGKTALLLELEERARGKGFVVARVTHNADMLNEIIELIQLHGASHLEQRKRAVSGFSAGALGFSLGLTFNEETQRNYGFRVKLGLLCDALGQQGAGVLILVDEACSSENMRQLATTYQNLIGEGKNIAIAMAGLPHAVSSVLNDRVLTFLNRAQKIRLGTIPIREIARYYAQAFEALGIECEPGILDRAVEETGGFPYLMQLIGHYLETFAKETAPVDTALLEQAVTAARADMAENVFGPILSPLSPKDRQIVDAMAQDHAPSTTADIIARINGSDSSFQPYRARLLDMGVVEAPQRGKLQFTVPLLAEYLRGEL